MESGANGFHHFLLLAGGLLEEGSAAQNPHLFHQPQCACTITFFGEVILRLLFDLIVFLAPCLETFLSYWVPDLCQGSMYEVLMLVSTAVSVSSPLFEHYLSFVPCLYCLVCALCYR